MKTTYKTRIILVFFAIISMQVFAQNRYQEIIPFQQLDGNITLKVAVNNKEYTFFLDTRVGNTIVQKQFADEMGLISQQEIKNLSLTGDTITATATLARITIGKNIFIENQKVNIIKSKYLSENNIAGIIGLKQFAGYVLTINMRDKILTTSTPYKPEYMKVKNKIQMNTANGLELELASNTIPFIVDLNAPFLLSLNDKSYNLVKDSLLQISENSLNQTKKWYRNDFVDDKPQAVISTLTIANHVIKSCEVYKNNTIYSYIGSKILDFGVISIDLIHSTFYFEPYESIPQFTTQKEEITKEEIAKPELHGNVINLTREFFLQNVCNYRESNEWKYLGNKPAIIDFWAPWCVPCKKLSPIVEQLATEYGDKIVVYKLNIDDEPEVAKYFKIGPIPLLMFVPMQGEPVKSTGLQTYEVLKQKVESLLLTK